VTPDAARAMYRRQIDQRGQTVVLRKGAAATPSDLSVKARVMGYRADELTSGIQQGDRKVIVLAEDVEGTAWGLPEENDAVVISGRRCNIEASDDNTRRIGDTLIAYELQVRG